MSFTHALYYPWIEVRDLGWLKNACLYWDKVSTIVPASITTPYMSEEALALEEKGWLEPLRVEPNMVEVRSASQEFAAYAYRPEGTAALSANTEVVGTRAHRRRMRDLTRLHPEKLSWELQQMLLETEDAARRGKWLQVNSDIAGLYITTLATHLAQNKRLALVTDQPAFEPLADSVRLGELAPAIESAETSMTEMGEALLAHYALEAVYVSDETPVEKIIEFRENHQGELDRFRDGIGELAKQLEDDYPSLDAFQQAVYDLYANKVRPAVNDLNTARQAMNIEGGVESLKTVAFSSVPAFASSLILGPMLGPLATPAALFAGATISIIAYGVKYHNARQKLLRDNPYSYVLSAQQRFKARK